MENYFGDFSIARVLIQRSLAVIYLLAFAGALIQFPALLGTHGLEPAPRFIQHVPFVKSPSLFYLSYSDFLVRAVAAAGMILSFLAMLGISERGPFWVSMLVWLTLWVLYLSIVNVGQTFYSFGWESMLLEAGFFAAFLGPAGLKPQIIPILILRWMLFRVEMGAGLIKMRAGGCWHDLSCLFYHHETQPMPNPLSWYFHYLPPFVHKAGVVFSHFVQLVIPFLLFGPRRVAAAAGLFIIAHQMILIVSGNYSWLNWLTVILGLTAFSDSFWPFLKWMVPEGAAAAGTAHVWLLYGLAALVIYLSIPPVKNLFSRNQRMNYSYNPLHLVNTYGAFGSVTKKRYEVVIEGARDPQSPWLEYEFKAKPTALDRRPPQFAPYHLRLDWLMWFLPFQAQVVGGSHVSVRGYQPWFISFMGKLLEGDAAVLKLLKKNPFPDGPPAAVRARYYLYEFTTPAERKATGNWWKRTLIGDYLPPQQLG